MTQCAAPTSDQPTEKQTRLVRSLAGFDAAPTIVLARPAAKLAVHASTPIVEMDHDPIPLFGFQRQ